MRCIFFAAYLSVKSACIKKHFRKFALCVLRVVGCLVSTPRAKHIIIGIVVMGFNRNVEERLRFLDEKFRTGREFTKRALFDEFNAVHPGAGISWRTFQYDFSRIEERVGVQSVRKDGKEYFRYENKGDSYFNVSGLSVAVTLERLLNMASYAEGMKGFSELRENIEKLVKAYNIELDSMPVISFDNALASVRGEYLDTLYDAIRTRRVLEIKQSAFYRGDNEKYRRLVVHPYHLKEYAGRWYLIGYAKEHAGFTCLPVDRMKSVVVADGVEFCQPDEGTDFVHLFDDRIGVSEGDMIRLELKVSPMRYKYMETKKLHHSQELLGTFGDGYKHVGYNLKCNEELLQKLLQAGVEVEVLAPVSVRDKIAERIGRMMKIYSK